MTSGAPQQATITPRLIVIDLDETLADTRVLEPLRNLKLASSPNYRQDLLKECVKRNISLFNGMDGVLKKLRLNYPQCKIIIFTKAPRLYASAILQHLSLANSFDEVIAYEDCVILQVGQLKYIGKPHPVIIQSRMNKLGITNPKEVFVIGDHIDDMTLAYRLGAWSCGVDFMSIKYNRIYQVFPDMVAKSTGQILQFVADPYQYLPLAEVSNIPQHKISQSRQFFKGQIPRVDAGLPQPIKTRLITLRKNGFTFPVFCCGRYYKSTVVGQQAHNHKLSSQVYSKLINNFSVYIEWLESLENAINSICYVAPNIITVIPSKTGNSKRLELLLVQLEARMKKNSKFKDTEFKEDVFVMSNIGGSNKGKSHVDRFMDIEKQMSLPNSHSYTGKRIVVIDDVLTTGSTMFWARKLLYDAGAKFVVSVAVAKAVP